MKNYGEKEIKAAYEQAQNYLDDIKQQILNDSTDSRNALVDYRMRLRELDNFVGTTHLLGSSHFNGILFYHFSRSLEDSVIYYVTTDNFDGWMTSLEDIKKNYPHMEINMQELYMAS